MSDTIDPSNRIERGSAMTVVRQLTTCPEPATIVLVRAPRPSVTHYRLEVCRRHRWLISQWAGQQSRREPGGRCGTVLDHRPFDQVVTSHSDGWVRPLTTEGLHEDNGGDVAVWLRAAHERLHQYRGTAADDLPIAAALDHAARIAEQIAHSDAGADQGRVQLLAALSVAETLDAQSRGA